MSYTDILYHVISYHTIWYDHISYHIIHFYSYSMLKQTCYVIFHCLMLCGIVLHSWYYGVFRWCCLNCTNKTPSEASLYCTLLCCVMWDRFTLNVKSQSYSIIFNCPCVGFRHPMSLFGFIISCSCLAHSWLFILY